MKKNWFTKGAKFSNTVWDEKYAEFVKKKKKKVKRKVK